MTDKIITVHTILNVPKHEAIEYFTDNELLVNGYYFELFTDFPGSVNAVSRVSVAL